MRGEPCASLSALFRVSGDALQRHKEAHISGNIVKAKEASDELAALDVVKQLKEINAAARSVLGAAIKSKDGDLQLKAIDRVHRQIELQAKLLGQLDERPQINVMLSPQWVSIRSTIVQTLAPFPEARRAVAEALGALEGG